MLDRDKIKAVANYKKMKCNVILDGEIVKTINLATGNPGMARGAFNYKPEESDEKIKYHAVVELGDKHQEMMHPKLHIYPKYGDFSFHRDGYEIDTVGDYETDYLTNHKNK